MKRREATVKISWMLKSAFFMPSILTVIHSCKQKDTNTENFFIFSQEQSELVKAISDTIIPKTSTPSASEVNVHGYLDLLLKDVFDENFKNRFLDGLEQFDDYCRSNSDNSFVLLSEQEKKAHLENIEKDFIKIVDEQGSSFYMDLKELVVSIYFSTEQGIKQNLNYMPIPGPYVGETEYREGDRIMIGNQM